MTHSADVGFALSGAGEPGEHVHDGGGVHRGCAAGPRARPDGFLQ